MRLAALFTLLLALPALGFDQSHAKWDKWLKQYTVVNGPVTQVNYRDAKKNPIALESYLKEVTDVKKDDFAKWGEKDRLAFLINAYNAFTVKLILDNYPVKSIKDLGGTFSSPWGKKFFTLFGEEQKLDGIEHDMIRKDYKEDRIHFALVCASKGCPQLRNEAFTGTKVDTQLEQQAKSFLRDPARNRYDAKENKLFLSKIFKWYEGDFKKYHGSVPAFAAPRITDNAAEQKKAETAEVDTGGDYDWTLNETPAKG